MWDTYVVAADPMCSNTQLQQTLCVVDVTREVMNAWHGFICGTWLLAWRRFICEDSTTHRVCCNYGMLHICTGNHIASAATSCCRWESCHAYEWVMPHTNEFCHVWMSYGMHMNKSCLTCEWVNESGHTYEWVMSHIWMSHVTHMNESCHTRMCSVTYEWVMACIWMSHISHMNKSWQTWMSHVTHMNETCHTYGWVLSHMWMGCVNESCRTHERVMSHVSWVMSHILYELWTHLNCWRGHVSHVTR